MEKVLVAVLLGQPGDFLTLPEQVSERRGQFCKFFQTPSLDENGVRPCNDGNQTTLALRRSTPRDYLILSATHRLRHRHPLRMLRRGHTPRRRIRTVPTIRLPP